MNSWQVANDAKHMAEKMNTRRRLESLEFSRIPKATVLKQQLERRAPSNRTARAPAARIVITNMSSRYV